MKTLVNLLDPDLPKVVYSLWHGTYVIGSTSPIDGEILVLTGETEYDSPTTVLVPPPTRHIATELKYPMDNEFMVKIQDSQNLAHNLAQG